MPKLYGATVPVVFSVSRWELLGPDWRHCLRATGGQVCEWIGIFPGPALEPLSGLELSDPPPTIELVIDSSLRQGWTRHRSEEMSVPSRMR